MLSKTRRISRSEVKTFAQLNYRSMAYHSHILSLFVYKKNDLSPSQFSFSVSKKVAKSAVVRNTLRRRGYAVVQALLLAVRPGFYCMFSFKKGSNTSESADIKLTTESLLHKAGIV